MTSKIKVDNINKVSDDSNIINKCGTTVTVGAASDGVRTGANNLQASDGGNLISQSGTTITLGASGDTITLASGASQTGFGRTGTVDWQTTPKTGDFTAANGEGYFVNTTSGAITMTMPSGSAGAIVSIQDYNKTFDSNFLTITPASGEKINGGTADGDLSINTEGQGLTFVYVDATVGWKTVHENEFTKGGSSFITATGGTESTTGNFKIHKFTGPGTFTVTGAGGGTPCAPSNVDYLVVAGGGSGGGRYGGGGGGGGWRASSGTTSGSYCAGPAPLTSPVSALPISTQAYSIVVGGGGAGVPDCNSPGGTGSVSSFSTVSSAGGGGGAGQGANGVAGGSGGGGSWNSGSGGTGGSGNTPPVTPPQGSSGGQGHGPSSPYATAGGGGATENGINATPSPPTAGRGGAGAASSICGSPISYSGGGGGSGEGAHGVTAGGASPCGSGTAGSNTNAPASSGAANRGGGGGGAFYPGPSSVSGTGGSGVVIIRYKFQ